MNKTNIKVCFDIPSKFTDECISQLKDKLKNLNRKQLEMLICLLSREIYRLEKCHSSTSAKKDKEKHLFFQDSLPFENLKEQASENTTMSELSDQDCQSRDDSSSEEQEFFLRSLSQQNLRVIEDHSKGKLKVIDDTSGSLVYSKSWQTNVACETTDVLDSKLQEKDPSVEMSKKDPKLVQSKWLATEIKRSKIKKLNYSSEQSMKNSSEISESDKLNFHFSHININAAVDDENMFSPVRNKAFYHKDHPKCHRKKNKDKRTVLCSYCGKLVLHCRLKTHIEKVHEKPSYTCHICHKGFLKRECLEGHMNKHSNTKPYICEHCGRKYAYSTSLYSHKKLCTKSNVPAHLLHLKTHEEKVLHPKTHEDKVLHPKTHEDKETFCICEICGMKFEGTSGLKDHHSAKHGGKVQSCGLCGKRFEWRPSYNRHVKKCRDRTDLERARCRQLAFSSTGKIFKCKCGKQYPYRQSFQRHKKTCSQKQDMGSFISYSDDVADEAMASTKNMTMVQPSSLGIPHSRLLEL